MGKIIAIGGGPNGGDFDRQLETKIRSFIPKDNPSVIFVPYASNDEDNNSLQFKEIYHDLGCKVEILQPGEEDLLLQADLIYFGRGWTISLLDKLHETGAVSFIQQAKENGAILAGFSAGAHALFALAGSKEQDTGYTLVEGLGFINSCLTSHYNYKERADAFHHLLLERKINGIGLEDHTMLIVEENVATLYASNSQANGYFIHSQDRTISIQPITAGGRFCCNLF